MNLKDKVNKVNMENKVQEPEFMMKWDKNSSFVINGEEFGTLVNTVKGIAESQSFLEDLMKARTTIGLASLNELLQKKLNDFVTSGVVRKLTKAEFDAEQEKEKQVVNTPTKTIPAEEILN